METKSIHTLNARDNKMLEIIRDIFALSPEEMFHQIQNLRQAVEDALKFKEISYDALKTALVPDRQRMEIALVFDSTLVESSWYGYDVFNNVIPLFDKKSNHSILVGDFLDIPGRTDQLLGAFNESIVFRRSVEFHHPTQFYIVYINNLTRDMVNKFDNGLKNYKAYVGLADMTYNSRLKFYLSTMLVDMCIKHRNIIIQGHEPDRNDNENINISGYPFEENEFICRSISDDLFGVFLYYKIERPTFSKFDSDTHFSLNSVSRNPLPLDDFNIQVDDAKLTYLKNEKAGSLSRAGLTAVDSNELAKIIRAKLKNNYIYNLSFNSEHNVFKFNIIIEFNTNQEKLATRLLAALEYRPLEKVLRLITLY